MTIFLKSALFCALGANFTMTIIQNKIVKSSLLPNCVVNLTKETSSGEPGKSLIRHSSAFHGEKLIPLLDDIVAFHLITAL